MTTILTTRTAHWVICRRRCFERNDRQIKTAGGTELQGQLQRIKLEVINPITTSNEFESEQNEPHDPISHDKLLLNVAPDEDELKANELAWQADQDLMYKLLESDDALATAHQEIKRLNHLNAQLDVRLHGLMNERNEAIRLCMKEQQKSERLSKQLKSFMASRGDIALTNEGIERKKLIDSRMSQV